MSSADRWEKTSGPDRDRLLGHALEVEEPGAGFLDQDGEVFAQFGTQTRIVPSSSAHRDRLDLTLGRTRDRGLENFQRREVPNWLKLIPGEVFDADLELTDTDRARAEPIQERVAEFRDYFGAGEAWDGAAGAAAAGPAIPPETVDRRPEQSRVRNQGARQTCVAFASLACMEARNGGGPELSPQYAHYKFLDLAGLDQAIDQGIPTIDAPRYLSDPAGKTCQEPHWVYIPTQAEIDELITAGTYAPPEAAENDQTYGIDAYQLIPEGPLEGESINSVAYLESLLAKDFDIVVGAWVSWRQDQDGIFQPIQVGGQPYRKAGHAMLICGYDRAQRFFWLKNSAGDEWEDVGYGRFSYEFAEMYFRYGWVAT